MEKLHEKNKDTDLKLIIKKLDKILIALAAQLVLLKSMCKSLDILSDR